MIAATYEDKSRATWEAFRKEYDEKVLDGMDARNRDETARAPDQFERLIKPAREEAAGVKPVGKLRYGFHDLRRAFATMNPDKLTPDPLQFLMQHQDYTTTQRCINMAHQLNPAVQNLFVPDLPNPATAETA